MEHEKSADSFGRFLGIKNSDDAPEVWSVKRIEWHQTNDTIVVTLADGEKLAQATECGTQGKKVDVVSHQPASHWTVPEKLLGHKVEVVCELPVLKTHDGGQPCELTRPLPWETKLNAALVAP